MAILKSAAIILAAIMVILGASYLAAGRAKPALDSVARDELTRKRLAHSFVALSHGIVHYRLEGPEDAPLVVLLHGTTFPSFIFDAYFPPLTKSGYRVLSFDFYGRGFSDRPSLRYDAALIDGQIAELLDKLGLKGPAHLVGYSMGGTAASIFAAGHPERTASLTLIAPAGLGASMDRTTRFLLKPVLGDWLVRLFGQRIFYERAAGEARHAANPFAFLSAFTRQMDYAGYGEALLSTLRTYPLNDAQRYFAQAGRESFPVLSIWGEVDDTVPFSHEKQLAALVPRAELRSYPAMGHEIIYARAPMIAAALIDFLDRQTHAAASEPAKKGNQAAATGATR